MNERIRELAVEAGVLTSWGVGECEYQTFAELIVKECLNICENDWGTIEPTQQQIVNQIKKHFQVE